MLGETGRVFAGDALYDSVADVVQSGCDQLCGLGESMRQLLLNQRLAALASRGGNPVFAVTHLNDVCRSVHCYFGCVRDGFNAACENVGTMITEAMVRPLEASSYHLALSPPGVQSLIKDAMPETCEFLISYEQLEGLRTSKTNILEPFAASDDLLHSDFNIYQDAMSIGDSAQLVAPPIIDQDSDDNLYRSTPTASAAARLQPLNLRGHPGLVSPFGIAIGLMTLSQVVLVAVYFVMQVHY